MRYKRRPDHREGLYFGKFIGPFKTRYSHPKAKLEVFCHACHWSDFQWTIADVNAAILRHIWTAHNPQPVPQTYDVLDPPGRR